MVAYKNIIGTRFGKLVVLKKHHSDKKNTYWECECDCGNITIVQRSSLTTGKTSSCGCVMKEVSRDTALKIDLHGQGMRKLKEESYREGTSLKALGRKMSKNNTTGVKGVSFKKGKYETYIKMFNKYLYLGRYETLEEAKEVREEAEKILFEPVIDKYVRGDDSITIKKVLSSDELRELIKEKRLKILEKE